MPVSRRHALQALGLAVAGSTAMGKAWGKQAETLRQELEACSPGGDPWTTLLERNRVFSKAWQRKHPIQQSAGADADQAGDF